MPPPPTATTDAPYQPLPGCYDEMVDAQGATREHWTHLAQTFRGLGTADLLDRRREAARLLDQDGVVYHAYDEGDESRSEHGWKLDPLPTVLTSHEWQKLEAGLIERAELLNLVLDDLYGKRDLLRRGVLPPEAVYGHDGFLRACDGIRLPGSQQLFSYAADLGRDASGDWVVVSDRAQAPSGFGYALENRMVVSRVMPSLYRDAHVHRLAPFFRSLRSALQEVAPAGVEDPRIVVLSPGPWNETAFEHGILSSTLGYPLVEGSDLTVRGSGVWMRSLGRLEPVHVILRRVDGDSCDPLELRPDSLLGVPGLVEASRRGVVSVVNTLGSSALENPALLAFLPAISEHLLGRQLRVPTVPSWWCGDEDGRREVLARLDELVVRPLSRGAGTATVFGWELSNHELDDLRAQIEARPMAWVGQERVLTSGTPTLTDDGLVARRSLLRAFAVARNDSYAVMPGGLTRVAPDDGHGRISNQNGAIAKDTWVLASEPERLTGFWLQTGPVVEGIDPMAQVPSRVAENLFWLGRYAERAESVTRLLRVVDDRRTEFEGSANPAGVEALQTLLEAVTRVTATAPGFLGDEAAELRRHPGHELRRLVVDERRPGTVGHAVRNMLGAAYAVRDQLSTDTFLVVGSLDRTISGIRDDARAADVQAALGKVIQALLSFSGLAQESMVRDLGWRFMDAGRRLERALQLLSLLRATVTRARGTASDSLVLESVLSAAESLITYRRRYRSQAQLETLLDLLLLDDGNPRSLAYQLSLVQEDLAALPATGGRRLREDQRLVLEASTGLALTDLGAVAHTDDDGTRDALVEFLDRQLELLSGAAAVLDRDHFVHRLPQRPLA